jgi:hypothetical protein
LFGILRQLQNAVCAVGSRPNDNACENDIKKIELVTCSSNVKALEDTHCGDKDSQEDTDQAGDRVINDCPDFRFRESEQRRRSYS